jgi:hypothetical protein
LAGLRLGGEWASGGNAGRRFEQCRGGWPDAVALLEELVDDDAALVEDEDAGISDSKLFPPGADAVLGVLRLEMLVVEAEITNDPTSLVRQQLVGDAALRGECLQRRDRIVANREDGDASPLEIRRARLQLDELRLAVGSPARAAVEDDERLLLAPNRV